ncbi:MAG TPA: hypothetical protein VGD48_28975 [Kutzneria sp.]|jgi:hypothetical protein
MAKRSWLLSTTMVEYLDAARDAAGRGHELITVAGTPDISWHADGRIDYFERRFPMIDFDDIRIFLAQTGPTASWVWLGQFDPRPEGMKSYWRISLDTAGAGLTMRMRPSHFSARYLASR